MERVALAVTLVTLGLPLAVFGWVVSRQRVDLVFGDYTRETTTTAAWAAAHERVGRGFRRLGALLVGAAPVVFVVGLPAGGWVFGGAMVVLGVGVYVAAMRGLAEVERGQRAP